MTARHVESLAVAGWFVVVASSVARTWWWDRWSTSRGRAQTAREALGRPDPPSGAGNAPSAPGEGGNRHDETTEVAR